MSTATSTSTRAGRLRLMARLRLARDGVGLLRSKEEVLQRERVRLEGHVARTQQTWESDSTEAATALLRARALGASGELASIVTTGGAEPAIVAPQWQVSMGVTYPGVIEVTPGPEPTATSTAALRPAIDAYRRALGTAADHAATTAALNRVTIELAGTRRRRRAIEQRLIPALEAAVRLLDLRLDEQDRDEALRIHIATGQHEEQRR